MKHRKLAAIVITGMLLTAACKKKDPEIDPCLNGQLDAGETAVDCGGSCAPCPQTDYPHAGFTANGTARSASIHDLTYNNGWQLHAGTDSISLILNLGNDGTVGTYQMSPSGSSAVYNGTAYPTLATGIYSISEHNQTDEKLSGYFQGKFVRVPGDTLYITNGYFEYLPY